MKSKGVNLMQEHNGADRTRALDDALCLEFLVAAAAAFHLSEQFQAQDSDRLD